MGGPEVQKTIKKWAYILHDKDDTAPHYHIYVNFGRSGVDSKVVSDWFGLQESQVNKIQGRSSDMELYLIHGNDSQQQKHQYDPSEVIANYDFKSSLKKGSSATFFFQLPLGSSWPDFINVLGADLVSFEAIDSDDSIRIVSIENIVDIVLISIPGLHPFKLLSSGDSVLVDEVT